MKSKKCFRLAGAVLFTSTLVGNLRADNGVTTEEQEKLTQRQSFGNAVTSNIPAKIYALALGSNKLKDQIRQHDVRLSLVLNNAKDRVGVEAVVPSDLVDPNSNYDEQLKFVFDELSVDVNEQIVLWGSEVVGQIRNFWGLAWWVELEPGYRISFDLVPHVRDTGFDYHKTSEFRVFIEKVAR